MHFHLIETVCRTGIFIICAQVLVHFRPNASYEKYIKMLVSVMILLQLFLPVSNLFTGEGEQSLAARVVWFEEQLNEHMAQVAARYSADEEILERMTLEEVQERMAAAEAEKVSATHVEAVPKVELERIRIQLPQEREGGEERDADNREGDEGN